ncbi:MAG: hypothetical protein J5714_03900 [Alphaproteobacteria bacterium]|nr:hypothetical protein [Alphaproteobacteria bacterium]
MTRLIYEQVPSGLSNDMKPYCDTHDTIICYGKWCDKTLKFEAAAGITIHEVVPYVLNQSTTYNRDAMLIFNDIKLKIPKQTADKEATIQSIIRRYFLKLKKRNRGN